MGLQADPFCETSYSRLLSAGVVEASGARRLAASVVYSMGIVVPTGVSATTVNNAVLALNTASFVASGTVGILATATGQSVASITTATSTSSTCGGGASSGCSLPVTAATTSAGLSGGAIAGIVIGSVAFVALLVGVAVYFNVFHSSAAAPKLTTTSVELGSAGASAARFDTYRAPAVAGGASAPPPTHIMPGESCVFLYTCLLQRTQPSLFDKSKLITEESYVSLYTCPTPASSGECVCVCV